MKSWVVATNTFREIIRDRILYSIVIFALLMLGLSLALGQLSIGEQTRITLDFGLMGIHLVTIILSIFVGSTLVAREIEKRTVLTLLSHSLSRAEFVVGKFLGHMAALALVISGLAAILAVLLLLNGWTWHWSYLLALLGVWLEAMVLLAVTLLFGTFSGPFLTVAFAIGIFLIGHWQQSLEYFTRDDSQVLLQIIHLVLKWGLPDLQRFNWRAAALYQDSGVPLAWSVGYAVVWIVILLCLAAIIFRRREFA